MTCTYSFPPEGRPSASRVLRGEYAVEGLKGRPSVASHPTLIVNEGILRHRKRTEIWGNRQSQQTLTELIVALSHEKQARRYLCRKRQCVDVGNIFFFVVKDRGILRRARIGRNLNFEDLIVDRRHVVGQVIEAGQGVHLSVHESRPVRQVEIQLLATKSPSCEFPTKLLHGKNTPYGLIFSPFGEFCALEIRPEQVDCPQNFETLTMSGNSSYALPVKIDV